MRSRTRTPLAAATACWAQMPSLDAATRTASTTSSSARLACGSASKRESSRSNDGPGGDPRARFLPRESDIVSRMKRPSRVALVAPVILLAAILGSFSHLWGQAPARQGPSSPPAAALQAIVNQIVALFPRVSGEVIEVQGATVTLSVGKRDGVVPGLELSLFREGRELRHPKTGELLGKTERALGRLRIEQVAEAYAVGSVAPGTDVA